MFKKSLLIKRVSPLLKYLASVFFAAARVALNPTKAEIPAIVDKNAPAVKSNFC